MDAEANTTADLVLEGGGVKGAGLAGAVSALSDRYRFHRIAGTSAGAIVASLVAAGRGREVHQLLVDTDFASFLDQGGGLFKYLGKIGQAQQVLFHEGMYKGEALREWIAKSLADGGVRTWGDLRLPGTNAATPVEERHSLVIVVSDISRGRMLRLPWDYERLLGQDPDTMSVADAVRASASIPYFFRPCRIRVDPALADRHRKLVLTDGGMLSNFPVGLFDGTDDEHPTIGVKLSARLSLREQHTWHTSDDPLSLGKALIATMASAHDQLYVDEASVTSRTVFVDTSGVSSTDFTLSAATKQHLYDSGVMAARTFLANWDFAAWRAMYGDDARQDAESTPATAR